MTLSARIQVPFRVNIGGFHEDNYFASRTVAYYKHLIPYLVSVTRAFSF